MEKITLNVPTMYADHHVLAVRQALSELPGVGEIYASSAFKQVLVGYDPASTSPQSIKEKLEAAGYPVGDGASPDLPVQSPLTEESWKSSMMRMTQTNRLDLEMSGDFRMY